MADYLTNILIAIDQLGTTLVGGFPDETLSSYAYRMEQKGRLGGKVFRPVLDFLFSWQAYPGGHCFAAWTAERMRMESPPELR